MADDIATLTGQLVELRAAYRSGAASVQYEGKSVTYRSAADMLAAIRSLESLLGVGTGPRRVVVRTDKGW
jgi:hypothetical protein